MIDEKLWLAVAFLSFVAILKKYVWPILAKSIDNKSKEISENLLAAKDLRQKAEQLLKDTEKYQEESIKFAEKVLKDAEIEAQKHIDESEILVKKEIEKRTNASIERIKTEEGSAIRNLKVGIVNSALTELNDIDDINEKSHEKLIDKGIEDFEKALDNIEKASE